jgi:hypothetical protein
MATQYKLEDLPMIMNSISWQLKRIADVLENDKEKVKQPLESNIYSQLKRTSSVNSIKDFLNPQKD